MCVYIVVLYVDEREVGVVVFVCVHTIVVLHVCVCGYVCVCVCVRVFTIRAYFSQSFHNPYTTDTRSQ